MQFLHALGQWISSFLFGYDIKNGERVAIDAMGREIYRWTLSWARRAIAISLEIFF
jgi:hypothetical protein